MGMGYIDKHVSTLTPPTPQHIAARCATLNLYNSGCYSVEVYTRLVIQHSHDKSSPKNQYRDGVMGSGMPTVEKPSCIPFLSCLYLDSSILS